MNQHAFLPRTMVSLNPQRWTVAAAAAGLLSGGVLVHAEEAQSQVLTALSSTTLSGYVDTSAIWKPGTDAGPTRLPGHVFDGPDKMDGFNLEAVKLSLEKPLDEGHWAAGYKVDMVFGPDANIYQTTLNGGALQQGDFALKQAYVALRAPIGNGLDLKMGVFDTMLGYEVFETGNNPNYSRSYGYFLEPVQHTGLVASYHVADWLTVGGGVTDTLYGPINDRAHRATERSADTQKAYMGTVAVTLPNSAGALAGSTVYAGFHTGLNGSTVFGLTNTEGEKTSNLYVGGTVKTPLSGLSVGAAFDYRWDGYGFGDPLNYPQENKAYAVAGYLTYAITEKLRINDRVDYANADAGTFYFHADAEGTGAAKREHLLSNTLTLDYSLWDNVITRGEFRWDHSLTGDRPFGGAEDPQKNAFILVANIIYKF